MATTGFKRFDTSTALSGRPIPTGALVDDSDTSEGQTYSFTGATQTWYLEDLTGDDLPVGSTVDGVEVVLKHRYINSYQSAKSVVSISITGQSGAFPTGTDIGAAPNNVLADQTYGSSTTTWAHDWSGFTDVSDISVRVQSLPTSGASGIWILGYSHITVNIHYTEPVPEPATNGVVLKSGIIRLHNGKVKIL